METVLLGAYLGVLAVLSLYGFLGYLTLFLFYRHRRVRNIAPATDHSWLPAVTIQLPVYNERLVIRRLIDATAGLEYPQQKLQIQVVDDSDDSTSDVIRERVNHYREQGINIEHIHRPRREGYKAGALAAAQERASGEFVAIFDADFYPNADFLLTTMPYFAGNTRLGVIQARWGHLNAGESLLTAAQAIALDKHFVMEQSVRHRANMFPKFNGSAGIWRRRCVEDAGGWLSDTVCEDLCLSTRASLRGWEFLYLDDVVAPAELPATIRGYKNQQARWAKGSIQCLCKYGRQILQDGKHTLTGRLYALFSMSAYATHLLLLILLALQIPMLLMDVRLPPAMIIFTFLGIGQPLLFIIAQRAVHRDWLWRLRHFPWLLMVAIGLAPSNSRAILQALFGRGHHHFVRTPKGSTLPTAEARAVQPYRLPGDRILWFELLLVVYAALGAGLAIARGQFGPLFLLVSSLLGFAYVAFLEIRESLS